TFLMLRQVLDEVFHEAGAATDSLMDMRRIEPMYRLQFENGYMEPTSDPDRMKDEIRRCFPGRENGYDVFRKREETRFRKLFPCLQKPYHKIRTLLHPDLLMALPHLAMGNTLFDVMKRHFGDDQLALAFTFQSKYLGMSPWDCPGLFAIIPYIEHAFGVYHPIGGLSRISETMADVARSQGAEIHLGTPVKEILTKDRAVCGVELANGERIEADDVIINADFGYAATKLFAPGTLRKYTPKRLEQMKLSCSTFMLYLGLDKQYDLPHHTICFANDYRGHLESITGGSELLQDMSFYVRNAGITDPTLAPEGCTALYVLVPAANTRSGLDWAAQRAGYREVVLDAMAKRLGMTDIREHIKAEMVLTPNDWETGYNVYKGATFSLSHSMRQMIYLRPRNKFEELDRCYLVGGGTHPGSGLPTIYESGRIAANLICREHGIPFVSGNLHT
ncbi:MAG: phytoene desaturase family protein, partial [FCB group bacterium]|nr:phytoene desaturase family protein [FCB group bacterium]